MPKFEGGFVPLQGKNKEKKKKRRIAEEQISIWFHSPLGVFQFCLPDWKKKSQKKKEHQKNKQPTTAKKGELDTGLCSSVSFPMALTWQHHSLIPATGAFPLAKRGWTLYTHPQGGAGLEWHDGHLTPFLSIGSVTRHYDNKRGKYYVTGIFENLSFLLFEMAVFALRSHVISRSFNFARHRAFWFYTSPLAQ